MGINYTDEQTAFLVEKYQENPSMETVLLLAEKFDKTQSRLSASSVERGYINVQSILVRVEKLLLQKWSSLVTLLKTWELKLRVWWVSRKVQKRLLKRLNSQRGQKNENSLDR